MKLRKLINNSDNLCDNVNSSEISVAGGTFIIGAAVARIV